MKRILALCLALLMVPLCGGCALLQQMVIHYPDQPTPTLSTSEPTATEAPPVTAPPVVIEPNDGTPRRLTNGGWRDYAPEGYVELKKLSEMPYEHPDTDAVCAAFAELTAMAEAGADASEILTKYYAANDAYLNFYTMDNLAYIRYTRNTNDSFYKDEYDALELAGPDIEEAVEAFNKACAVSTSRSALERDYFGYGYFDDYEDFSRYTNPEYLALTKQEETLLAEYRSALENPQIEYKGELRSFGELMEQYSNIETYQQYREFLAILKLYYEKYNPIVGEIYLKLVPVRRQLGAVMGYETYADYAYDMVYGRDYTHEQGAAFLQEICDELVPIAQKLDGYEAGTSFALDGTALPAALQSAVTRMGDTFTEAFDFMMAYELCDLTVSAEKFDSSFTTYLYNYESPYLTVNANGTSKDYLTFSHEFGHFVDKYVTYDSEEDLETAETFSQAMEFLSLRYTEGVFDDFQTEMLLEGNLLDTLDTIIYQAALASFEDQVYALSETELTLERVNQIYFSCCDQYGVAVPMLDFYFHTGWIDVTHFFEAPYYVISYSVSADTALQVYMLEDAQTGAGLDAFCRLLEREPGDGVQAVMQAAGLPNPFRENGLKELADFYRTRFQLS